MILKFEKPLSPEEKRRVAEIVKHFYPDYVPDLSDFIGVSDMKEVVIPESSHALCKLILENLNSANINAFMIEEEKHNNNIVILTNAAKIEHKCRITLEEYNWLSKQRGKISKKYDHAKTDLGIMHTTFMITEKGLVMYSIAGKYFSGTLDFWKMEKLRVNHYDFLDAMNKVRLSEEELDISNVKNDQYETKQTNSKSSPSPSKRRYRQTRKRA